jgi:hypothetical protein
MQPYHESVSSGDDWFAITRVVVPGQTNTPGDTYTLTFTLQRAPTRLLRISFAKNRKILQQEAIQNPMTVELMYDNSDCLYPLWQVTREPAHLPQSRGGGPQPTQRHLITMLYFNEEDWDLHEIQQSPVIVLSIEHIEKGNIALALRWIQQKLSNDLRLEFEERWRAFLSSDQVCILLAGNVDALAAIKHTYKREFYTGTSIERRGDVGVCRRFQVRWGAFLQTQMGKKMAENQDTLAQLRKQTKRAMHEPAPPRQNVWYLVHSRGGDAWEDGVVYPETPRERAERQARELALQTDRDWFRRLGQEQDAGGGVLSSFIQ